ncbi:dihydrofolate reductase family protein [Sphaerimonospora cavernae]|uniref:dihydrofolate reductase family protein n=1 Tax=Sphaerimonospora cavernae TaxID=1740611 RepID=UPI00406C6811
MITSLDGYVSDTDGDFGWGRPEKESHEFINEHGRSIGTYLYGRRMYDTMVYWETAHTVPDQEPFILEWARVWQAADKIVYSATLREAVGERTRIERMFDPEAVRRLKAEADLDIAVAGPHLAAQARRSGPGWSTSTTSSSGRRSSAAATRSFRTMCASTWPCWTSDASVTAQPICATASRTSRRGEACCIGSAACASAGRFATTSTKPS